MNKVSFYGYYGYNNIGDEAFKVIFNELFEDFFDITYISPAEMPEIKSEFSNNYIELSKHFGQFFVGGGSIVGNPYFYEHLLELGSHHIISAELDGSPCNLQMYSPVFHSTLTAAFRNRADVEKYVNLIGPHCTTRIDYVPDYVFALKAKKHNTLSREDRNVYLHNALLRYEGLFPKEHSKSSKNLCLFLSDHYTDYPNMHGNSIQEGIDYHARNNIFEADLANFLEQVKDSYNIYFIPMSIWNNALDSSFAHSVRRRMQHSYETSLVLSFIKPEELLDFVGCFDLCISMKYHGLVIPMLAGVPVINIGSSLKNLALVENFNLPSSVYPQLNIYEMIRHAHECGENDVEGQKFKLISDAREAIKIHSDRLVTELKENKYYVK